MLCVCRSLPLTHLVLLFRLKPAGTRCKDATQNGSLGERSSVSPYIYPTGDFVLPIPGVANNVEINMYFSHATKRCS